MPTREDQDGAEAFDSDKLGDLDDGAEPGQAYPPERLLGATDLTADEWVADSVTSRRARLDPDPIEALGTEGLAHTMPHGSAVDAVTTEEEAVADMAAVAGFDRAPVEDPTRSGPLHGVVMASGAVDDAFLMANGEAQALGLAVPGEDLSAEAAAMHLEGA